MVSSVILLSYTLSAVLVNAQTPTGSSTLPTLVAPTPTVVGNASDILTYPICAQTCNNETTPFLEANIPGCNPGILECACGAYFRSITAACEAVTCSPTDYETTQTLAQQLCGPFYSNNSALSTSVASAIASATSVAGPVATRDPLNLASYPACAQNCTIANNYGGCGSQDVPCICKPPASIILGNCEVAQCSASDLEVITDLSYKLCAPVGGIDEGTNLTGSGVKTVDNNVTTSSSPTPSAFTGDAVGMGAGARAWIMLATVGAVTGAWLAW